MTSTAVPAVVYAAKSTEDTHGSIGTQLADCRSAAEREGRTVVAEHSDEAASAYKGNRGSGLTAAKDAAIATGAELWVQHSDRLARGDGITADHLAEIWFALRRHGVRLRSVQDDANLEDAIRVVLIGERNHEDSKRKSAATRAGLQRRKDRGQAVGALPEGYCAEATIVDGRAVTRRVIDAQRAPIVHRILDAVEAGHTFGDVARALNADGLRTRRGKQWSSRAVRKIVLNEDYTGVEGYPPMIERDRWERIQAARTRADPVAIQARMGGRRASDQFLLRGVAFCADCGEPLYTRNYAWGRAYLCAAVREARGTCDAPKIPAEPIERAVLEHLSGFLGDVRAWIATRAAEADVERQRFAETIDGQRAELRRLQVRAQRAHDQHERLLDAGDDVADGALRAALRMDDDAEDLRTTLQHAERRLEDWQAPRVDAALDFYTELRDGIAGRIDGAKTIADTNAALRSVLESIRLWSVDGKVIGQFFLRGDGEQPPRMGLMSPEPGARVWLEQPRPNNEGRVRLRRLGRDDPQTFVYGPVRPAVQIPPMSVPM